MLVARGSTRWLVVLGKASDMLISRPSAQDALMTLNELGAWAVCVELFAVFGRPMLQARARAKNISSMSARRSRADHKLAGAPPNRKQHHFYHCEPVTITSCLSLARSLARARR